MCVTRPTSPHHLRFVDTAEGEDLLDQCKISLTDHLNTYPRSRSDMRAWVARYLAGSHLCQRRINQIAGELLYPSHSHRARLTRDIFERYRVGLSSI